MTRAHGLRNDERGASNEVGVVLIIAIVITAIFAVGLSGYYVFSTESDTLTAQGVEGELERFDGAATRISNGGTPSQSVEFSLDKVSGTDSLTAEPSRGQIRVTYNAANGSTTELLSTSLGALEYSSSDNKVAYQGGGIWTDYDGQSIESSSEPSITVINRSSLTVNLPIVLLQTPDGSPDPIRREARLVRNSTTTHYPRLYVPEDATITVEITSEYAGGWAQYFQETTVGTSVAQPDSNTVTLEIGAAEELYLHLQTHTITVDS